MIESTSLSPCWSEAGLGRRESFDLNQFQPQGFRNDLGVIYLLAILQEYQATFEESK